MIWRNRARQRDGRAYVEGQIWFSAQADLGEPITVRPVGNDNLHVEAGWITRMVVDREEHEHREPAASVLPHDSRLASLGELHRHGNHHQRQAATVTASRFGEVDIPAPWHYMSDTLSKQEALSVISLEQPSRSSDEKDGA